jgi:hypothetical protein
MEITNVMLIVFAIVGAYHALSWLAKFKHYHTLLSQPREVSLSYLKGERVD